MVAIVASAALLASACSKSTPEAASTSDAATVSAPASAGAGDIAVTLQQWAITPTTTTVPAGAVTFSVTNTGTVPHELVVLSTDTPAATFPVGSFEGEANRIDEDTVGKNVGETGDMEPSSTSPLTINLKPGHYALVCNLPGHYALGMHLDFTVA